MAVMGRGSRRGPPAAHAASRVRHEGPDAGDGCLRLGRRHRGEAAGPAGVRRRRFRPTYSLDALWAEPARGTAPVLRRWLWSAGAARSTRISSSLMRDQVGNGAKTRLLRLLRGSQVSRGLAKGARTNVDHLSVAPEIYSLITPETNQPRSSVLAMCCRVPLVEAAKVS